MFGQNKVASADYASDGSLIVNDLWPTIQGEGPDAGRPAVFLRLTGCNLRCYFCDTEFEQGQRRPLNSIVQDVCHFAQQLNSTLLVITGGEPLLQNIVPLITEVNKHGIGVAIETAGTVACPGMFDALAAGINVGCVNKIVCSPKTPVINLAVSSLARYYKYIVDAEDGVDSDGLPAGSTQRRGMVMRVARPHSSFPPGNIYIQPCDTGDYEKNKRNHELARDIVMRHGYRLSLQMHKIVDVK